MQPINTLSDHDKVKDYFIGSFTALFENGDRNPIDQTLEIFTKVWNANTENKIEDKELWDTIITTLGTFERIYNASARRYIVSPELGELENDNVTQFFNPVGVGSKLYEFAKTEMGIDTETVKMSGVYLTPPDQQQLDGADKPHSFKWPVAFEKDVNAEPSLASGDSLASGNGCCYAMWQAPKISSNGPVLIDGGEGLDMKGPWATDIRPNDISILTKNKMLKLFSSPTVALGESIIQTFLARPKTQEEELTCPPVTVTYWSRNSFAPFPWLEKLFVEDN